MKKMINKISHIKPSIFLISFIVFQILAFLISAGIISMLDASSLALNVPIFFTINITPILLWYLYTGYALFLKEKKGRSKFVKFQFSVLIIFISILLSSIELYTSINNEIRILISIVFSILVIVSIIYILYYWVNGFVRNYDKRMVKKSDYMNYIYLICIPILGIYVIQKLINKITVEEI